MNDARSDDLLNTPLRIDPDSHWQQDQDVDAGTAALIDEITSPFDELDRAADLRRGRGKPPDLRRF